MTTLLTEPERKVGRGWVVALTTATLGLWVVYFGPTILLLPTQAARFAPEEKENALGLVTGAGSLVLLVGHIVCGLLSDRTTSRYGPRKPWLVSGVAVAAVSLLGLSQATDVTGLLVGWCAVQLGASAVFTGLLAAVPDHVPVTQRGLVSGLIGLAQAAGSLLGNLVLVAAGDPLAGYGLCAVLLLASVLPFLLVNRDPQLAPQEGRPALRSLWVSPRKHPDFLWAMASQFLLNVSFALATLYTLFYLTDALHHDDPEGGTALSTTVTTLATIAAAALFGHWSDRTGRRKVFVLVAAGLMSASGLVLVFAPGWPMFLFSSVLLGFGLGVFATVDLAIASAVLPAAADRAKDLGVNNVSRSLPQLVAPALAAPLLAGHEPAGYTAVFLLSALCAAVGGLVILRIRAVH